MKILNYLLRPYIVIRELQKENKNMKAEILELKEENDSLWDMLDEIKKADEEAMTYQSLLGAQAIGDA